MHAYQTDELAPGCVYERVLLEKFNSYIYLFSSTSTERIDFFFHEGSVCVCVHVRFSRHKLFSVVIFPCLFASVFFAQ